MSPLGDIFCNPGLLHGMKLFRGRSKALDGGYFASCYRGNSGYTAFPGLPVYVDGASATAANSTTEFRTLQLEMQPNFVPFSLRWSLITHSSGVSSVPSNVTASLLIANEITPLLQSCGQCK